MNRPKLSFASLLFFLLSFTFASAAQTAPAISGLEPNFEVVMNVVLGSDSGPAKSTLPAELSGVLGQLKRNMPFNTYSVANTYFGRIADAGSLEYRSVADIFGIEAGSENPSFVEWKIGRIRNVPADGRKHSFTIEGFRFGARVPIRMGATGQDGKTPLVYEGIGLNLGNVNLAAGSPTLVGTLSLPRSNGTLFLVMTVNPVKN